MSLRFRVFSSFIVLTFALAALAETVNSPTEITINGGGYDPASAVSWPFAPKDPSFSKSLDQARCNAHPDWNKMPLTERAYYIEDTIYALLQLHKDPNNPQAYAFTTRVLTCKAFNESGFDSQRESSRSTAAGFSQVTSETGNDLFNRMDFRSKIPGAEGISDFETYRSKMAGNPSMQLEVGLAVMEMKRRDYDLNPDNVKPFLEKYYGSNNDEANQMYAHVIYSCANCVKNTKSYPSYSMKCLCQGKQSSWKVVEEKGKKVFKLRTKEKASDPDDEYDKCVKHVFTQPKGC